MYGTQQKSQARHDIDPLKLSEQPDRPWPPNLMIPIDKPSCHNE
jgi:hypothetical protein